ncbi:helix-turn-helix transcriptional regulator [Streptomyces sp. NRRL S-646]|uniref:helix-turn-helix transcriptional regulator n=1 Tax=Streptomyces sp. NRRL S-646 TaxID=1463917 RepID=UPI0004CBE644|nr:LuxR family transcriptional regulator [Streptomyces sp. NRRL S-646]
MFGLLGLAPVQEAVYQAVHDWPQLSTGELAAKLGLPEDEVKEALDDLVELRIIRTSHERPDRHYAVDPLLALQELLTREQEQMLARYERIMAGHTTILRILMAQKIRNTPDRPDGEGSAQLLVSADAVQQRLELLSEQAQHSVVAFMPDGPQASKLELWRRDARRVLDRGASVRVVGLTSIRENEAALKHARWLAEQGSEFRTAQTMPPPMVLVDSRTAILLADPRDSGKGGLLITQPALTNFLATLFEQVWDGAVPLGTSQHPDEITGPSAQERQLLMLIAQGHTDEVAASKLSISSRTARRMMASLMKRLDARSRFEAGVRAAQNGWL